MIFASFFGQARLRRKLRALGGAGVMPSLRKGMTKGAQVVNAAARANVHKGKSDIVGGLLRKSMGYVVRSYRTSKVVVGLVGPRKGYRVVLANGARVDPVKYAHIEERGRGAVRPKKAKLLVSRHMHSGGQREVYGAYVRPYAGRPFLRPAQQSSRGAFKRAFTVAAFDEMVRQIARRK